MFIHIGPIHVYPLSITKIHGLPSKKPRCHGCGTSMCRLLLYFEADGRCQSPPYAKFDYVELTPQLSRSFTASLWKSKKHSDRSIQRWGHGKSPGSILLSLMRSNRQKATTLRLWSCFSTTQSLRFLSTSDSSDVGHWELFMSRSLMSHEEFTIFAWPNRWCIYNYMYIYI